MISTNQKFTTVAATFGAALTSLYATPELQAQGNALTFTPSSVPSIAFGSQLVSLSTEGGVIGNLNIYNTSSGQGVQIRDGFAIEFVNENQVLTSGFVASNTSIVPSGTGDFFVGFSNNGTVGWFSVDFGGIGNDVVLGPGQANPSGSVTVGVTAVPEPAGGALAALALGAVCLRRRRKN